MAILVGTASWAEKSLIDSGLFYPPTAKTPEARLRFYASVFPLVEVDASYYAIPSQATAQAWVERTPPGFVFNVKAFRFLTGHQTDAKVLPKAVRELLGDRSRIVYRTAAQEVRDAIWHHFLLSLEPLRASGKLGLVHFQFPPSVVALPRAMEHVERCVDQLRPVPVSVEFRHKSWWENWMKTAETLQWLRRIGAVHTVVDGPQGADNSVPAVWESTREDLALVRLHGRNAEAYNAPAATAGERFDYDYPDAELQGLAAEAVRLAYKVRNTHVIFNNCDRDKGQRNGMTMMKALAAEEQKPPQLEGYKATNGMLGRLSAAEISGATDGLPPPGPSLTPVEVEIDTHLGRVRTLVRPLQARHHKHSHWFWSVSFARPV